MLLNLVLEWFEYQRKVLLFRDLGLREMELDISLKVLITMIAALCILSVYGLAMPIGGMGNAAERGMGGG